MIDREDDWTISKRWKSFPEFINILEVRED
jgi:hypothetical protein